jgi:hypothetical protein
MNILQKSCLFLRFIFPPEKACPEPLSSLSPSRRSVAILERVIPDEPNSGRQDPKSSLVPAGSSFSGSSATPIVAGEDVLRHTL